MRLRGYEKLVVRVLAAPLERGLDKLPGDGLLFPVKYVGSSDKTMQRGPVSFFCFSYDQHSQAPAV